MEIANNPPKIGKSNLLDQQFGDWWLFLNTWGATGFLFFLACLGTGDYKHFTALLSSMLLIWSYWLSNDRFPEFIRRLRENKIPAAEKLERHIFRDHFLKKILFYFPLWLGIASLGTLLLLPAIKQNWAAYAPFLPL
ncbi:MAG: hypothetical protein HRU08_00080 [Oleispira sp.]|jgi:hypothetical protein|nr:hypothetical protein [Oleispira sp.]